jgi:hypothetical protein
MTTATKKTTVSKSSTPTLDAKTVAIVATILIHKGTPTQAALENAKFIVEKANELVGV